MGIFAFVSRAFSVLALAGSVAVVSQVAPASAASVHGANNDAVRVALAGPRPIKGSNVDPCMTIGYCVAQVSFAASMSTVSFKGDMNDAGRIALAGPRPVKGSNVDPCMTIGYCVG